ncbi:Outer membrane protein Omp85 [Nereida ignava]|uniref:Outer membrane protein assembly factor BamA n=1 Tax=Nereida ignava TaxID=282199 RepID=A0A0U1NIF0_9RHOB|nr:outer membrane protein assembly factor BamA [Nereida ignava]CRK74309.1 Outer membrane protein Omp85 [Nereida ignava]SFJ45555.1 Beta-barrel assembly machine subunit BamA [Nereida ignava DSM 16309]
MGLLLGVCRAGTGTMKRAGLAAVTAGFMSGAVYAQSFTFDNVEIEGNARVEAATILSFAGISRGETISAGQLNDAFQRVLSSGLFEDVVLTPRGSTLVIEVAEFPTINQINVEGNRRLKDEVVQSLIASQPRRVYSPSVAEQDAELIAQAYAEQGRLAATVKPSIIRRSDNRVDLVFEVTEGRVVEVERLSFTGNRAYSDRRLRRVLQTKQAGIFRQVVSRDTFIEDRVNFDRQVLSDFYASRGYVDFNIQGVSSELTRERDAFLITFDVEEGQQFRLGEVNVVSLLDDVDAAAFEDALKVGRSPVYSPNLIDINIARLERRALELGLNFVRADPRVTRNDRDLTLDVTFELTRGDRIFVERIDIEGNSTTLDRVIRRQFKVVEGDPFNPREIRNSAERIRALGYFGNAGVQAREGSSPNQVVIDVDVEEQPTGSLSFGASFGTANGFGLTAELRERNFLGRGQSVSLGFNTTDGSESLSFSFNEPAFLDRELGFGLSGSYGTTDSDFAAYNTESARLSPSINFPVSENGRLSLRYSLGFEEVLDVAVGSQLLSDDEGAGRQTVSSVGYTYSFDTRTTGLNPDAGLIFRFSQDLAGVGGDKEYLRSSFFAGATTKVLSDEVTLRAVLEGGALNSLNDTNSSVTDRFASSGRLRGFEPNGFGPREGDFAVGGNYYAVMRLEADFPIGLPEEYGISGGVYLDAGSVWGLDDDLSGAIDDSFSLRSAIGVSIFWNTAIGPLRFNFSKPLKFEKNFDKTETFDLSVSTSF